jgi:translation initiation factor IF-1
MGLDEAVRRGQRTEAGGQPAEVIELLPAAGYRLKLQNEDIVIAHATGASAANFVRLRVGDRVRVELAPQDPTRGRIVALL